MMKKIYVLLMALVVGLCLVLAGCGKTSEATPETATTKAPTQEVTLTYYVPADNGQGVLAKQIRVEKEKATPEMALAAMLRSQEENPDSVFPKGMKVEKVTIKDGLAYVEFNKAFLTPVNHGSLTERLEIASIVNTVTEFPGAQKVQLIVEGAPVTKLSGHLDLTEPLARMKTMIQKP